MIVDHGKSEEDFTTEMDNEEDVDEVEPPPKEDKFESNVKSKDNAKD